MEEELKICVKSIAPLETIKDDLLNQGFFIQEELHLRDIYMVKEDNDISNTNLDDLLSNYIVIREIIGNKIILILNKKEIDKNGVLVSSKRKCPIVSIGDAYNFLKELGYKELLNLNNHNLLFSNNKNEICVQKVDDLGIYIEMKKNNKKINHNNGKDVQEMIKNLKKYNLNIDESDFSVKKDIDILEKVVC